MVNLVPHKKNRVTVSDEALSRTYGGDDFAPLARFRHEFDQIMERFWDDWGGRNGWRGSAGWQLDLEEKEDEYFLRADLPGFEPEDIDVSVSGNVLTVRAEHKSEQKEENGSSYRYGTFRETFKLPHGVLTDEIGARYHSGVLEVHLPKSAEGKAKRITVKSP